ncbi:MAG TPA: DUF1311 domain-containing protein [Candidatus Avidesulfovibrio excrementigallinarum]|nr:DUF1311 domain-containing protein [Candidatus Avidesulfovibrio excrementigallinarum]
MTLCNASRATARRLRLTAVPAAALALLVLTGAAPALAEDEEFAPGYSACLEKAVSTMEIQQCTNNAYAYWKTTLDKNFALALRQCEQAEDPDACRQKLHKAQQLWTQYKTAMSEAIAELEGGSLGRLLASDFAASETKKQARLLMPDSDD